MLVKMFAYEQYVVKDGGPKKQKTCKPASVVLRVVPTPETSQV